MSLADRVVVDWKISEYELVDDDEAKSKSRINRFACFQSFTCNQSKVTSSK